MHVRHSLSLALLAVTAACAAAPAAALGVTPDRAAAQATTASPMMVAHEFVIQAPRAAVLDAVIAHEAVGAVRDSCRVLRSAAMRSALPIAWTATHAPLGVRAAPSAPARSAPGKSPFPFALGGGLMVGMTALAGERNTARKEGKFFNYPMKAAKKAYRGGLAVLNGGFVEPGATALNLVTVGRFTDTVDNSAGADGDVSAGVERGVFQFANSAAGDAIALADVGASCYVVDDQTVAKTDGGGTRSVAGIIRDVDAGGVWVEI